MRLCSPWSAWRMHTRSEVACVSASGTKAPGTTSRLTNLLTRRSFQFSLIEHPYGGPRLEAKGKAWRRLGGGWVGGFSAGTASQVGFGRAGYALAQECAVKIGSLVVGGIVMGAWSTRARAVIRAALV